MNCYGTRVSIPYKIGFKYCGIYGARASFILFCDHQDTESESQEIEIGVAGPIFTQKKIKRTIGKEYLYSTRLGQKL